MSRYCAGDASAFRALYQEVAPRLLGYLVRLARDRTLAEDLLQQTFWKAAFGRAAEALERSNASADEFMIIDHEPVTNRFVSVPKELGSLNPAAWVSGILEAALSCYGCACTVSAILAPLDGWPQAQK